MKRRILVILFFVVVFGLPVAWYLFLQTFGENQFDLPRIERWNQECLAVNDPALVIKEGAFTEFPNQWKRIQAKIQSQDFVSIKMTSSCDLTSDLYLVDEAGWVRGEFVVSREEIDRLLAEMDILILNFNE
jgi:hypothetical protein